MAPRSDAGASIRVGKVANSRVAVALQALTDRTARAAGDLPEDSDYHTVQVSKFVEVRALDIFEIIEQIFSAFRQTHSADEANVGQGWYLCKVAWEDDGEGGQTQTMLQDWYINSTLVNVGGVTINRVFGKILEVDGEDGDVQLIRVQVDIEQAPTENSDGTLADLGIWEIRAAFGDPGGEDSDSFFHATATILEDGTSKVTIHDQFVEDFGGGPGGEVAAGTRAVIFRSQAEGYGVAEVPDWEACFMNPGDCAGAVPTIGVSFAYNNDYLSVAVGGEAPISFDRQDEHEIVHRYQVFNGEDGSDVEATSVFGFPVRVDEENDSRFGWYGAWQDRHELWVNGDSLADGTTVIRDDTRPGEEAPSYTTRSFDGALTRIELVDGSLDQLDGIASEIWLFNDFQLRWNDGTGRWDQCLGDDGMGGCGSETDFTALLPSLAYSGAGDEKNIWVDHCEDDGMGGVVCTQYVYLTGAPGPGFFEADMNEETGRLESNGTPLDTSSIADGFNLWCAVSGRTYIQYTGEFAGPVTTTGWVEKTVESFDHATWTPTFDEEADREFAFEEGREYFVNNRGANLRVTRVGSLGAAEDYRVFMEVETVAKPSAGLDTVYPDGTILVEPWDPENNSKYRLVKDPEDPDFLLLVYHDLSEQDAADGIAVGDIVEEDIWGLRIEGDAAPLEEASLYNWEYRTAGDFHGGVTYLLDGNGDFVLLDDPIRFSPIQLARTMDIQAETPEEDWLSFSLMFDGFLHGLPDMWFELDKINHEGEQIPNVLAKNVRIPDGTELTDGDDPDRTYFVKAVDVGIFLGLAAAVPPEDEPDVSRTDDIVLDDEIEVFVAPALDATIPSEAELKYVQGLPVN